MLQNDDPLNMSIESLIESPAAVVGDDESADIAVAKLSATPFGKVMVVNREGALVGVITSCDLTKAWQRGSMDMKAIELATISQVIAVPPTAPLRDVIALLNGQNKAHRSIDVLPVIDAVSHRPLGVIRRQTISQRVGYRTLRPALA